MLQNFFEQYIAEVPNKLECLFMAGLSSLV